MNKDSSRRSSFFGDDITPDEALKLVETFNFLVGQEGWAVWEGHLKDKRQETLEAIALAEPAQISFLQGYAAALAHALDAPKQALELAKAVKAEDVVKPEPRSLRLAYPDADPAV